VIHHGHADLSHVVHATGPPGGFAGGLDGRQQQPDKSRNDGDNDQKLYERKTT
jgi:hypothetical protein